MVKGKNQEKALKTNKGRRWGEREEKLLKKKMLITNFYNGNERKCEINMDTEVYQKHETLFVDKIDCTHIIVHRWAYQDHINEINLLDGIFNTKESLYYA
jgi:hypothetical protein